ncbi:MAG: murein biosynthesis integral membrane protein MurJ [Synechococcales bacterium]|nr:murein biosynthesis integral membrane protein MurJ [Synechococcales bacterium]
MATIVALATLLSKVVGLVRQLAIAAAFGTGVVKSAYDVSSIIPAFFLILLGGINGPFHSAMVSVLSKRKKEDVAPLVESISTIVGTVFFVIAIGIALAAPLLIDLFAPGLRQASNGLEIRSIAIQQLQVMAPIAWFAGMIGVGFGTLNAADLYWLPSISPLLSSVVLIVGIGILSLSLGDNISAPQYALLGGLVLAGGSLVGTLLQWGAQFLAQLKAGLGRFRLRFDLRDPGVQEVFRVMGPALFASGMLQINVMTDLFFTSFLPNAGPAIASLEYANLLVQTPLGILSNVILVPFLPLFSRLTDPSNWGELKQRIRQALLVTAVAMLPLGALIMALSTPIVQVVYERGAFKPEATQLVASVLMSYAVGMFVYLGRDVLVRVFYALGDSNTPFRISMVNIFLNALFDFLLYKPFGITGIVLATVCVNIISMIALTYFLNRKLHGLPWQSWAGAIAGLLLASGVSGSAAYGILQVLQRLMGNQGFFIPLLQLCLSGAIGLGLFGAIATQLRLPEVEMFVRRIRQKLGR